MMTRAAIISDTHDQIANLRAVAAYCSGNHVRVHIYCGDLISPFMRDELNRFGGGVHPMHGINPGDQHPLSSRCAQPDKTGTITHHGMRGSIGTTDLLPAINHF